MLTGEALYKYCVPPLNRRKPSGKKDTVWREDSLCRMNANVCGGCFTKHLQIRGQVTCCGDSYRECWLSTALSWKSIPLCLLFLMFSWDVKDFQACARNSREHYNTGRVGSLQSIFFFITSRKLADIARLESKPWKQSKGGQSNPMSKCQKSDNTWNTDFNTQPNTGAASFGGCCLQGLRRLQYTEMRRSSPQMISSCSHPLL